jgi:hypothetical protein
LETAHRVQEVNVQGCLDVLALSWAGPARLSSAAKHSAQIAKEIAEITEVKPITPARRSRLTLPLLVSARLFGIKSAGESCLAEFIVQFAFLLVAQHLVGD